MLVCLQFTVSDFPRTRPRFVGFVDDAPAERFLISEWVSVTMSIRRVEIAWKLF